MGRAVRDRGCGSVAVPSVEAAREEIDRRAAAARAEIERRRNTPEGRAELADLAERSILESLHDKQRMVVALVFAVVRYIAAECSRRAGKTHLASAVVILKLLRARRGQEVVFCAPTLARGKELIWQELTGLIDQYHLGWRRQENTGKVWTSSGALFRIVGLNNKKQIGKISRGGNTILFVTDETQEFPHLLQQLLVAVGPALAQSRGTFLALGTPTVNEADYWAAVCDGAEGFQRVHWTLRDNPYLGRPADEILAEERELHGWTEDHPTYVREYCGRRCKDPSNLVLELDQGKNLVSAVSGYEPSAWALNEAGELSNAIEHVAMRKRWRFFIGIDFGLRDTTAWVVLAASLYGPEVYVVHCEQEAELDWDEVAERTKRLVTQYQPRGVVGDSASGGAQFIKTFNTRYGRKLGVRARAAKKHDKKASIEVMNTELRKARLRILKPDAEQVYTEASALQWANPERDEVLEGAAYPEDLFDAFRYSFNDFTAYRHDEEAKQKTEEDEENERIAARNAAAAAQARSSRRRPF